MSDNDLVPYSEDEPSLASRRQDVSPLRLASTMAASWVLGKVLVASVVVATVAFLVLQVTLVVASLLLLLLAMAFAVYLVQVLPYLCTKAAAILVGLLK